MKKLTGSEKQIKWAEEIREEKMADFNRWYNKFESVGKLNEEAPFFKELFENITDAGDWIGIGKMGLHLSCLTTSNQSRVKERELIKSNLRLLDLID